MRLRERWVACGKSSNIVALEGLNGTFGTVGTVVVRGHELANDVPLAKVLDKLLGHGVVGDFVGWHKGSAWARCCEHFDAGVVGFEVGSGGVVWHRYYVDVVGIVKIHDEKVYVGSW